RSASGRRYALPAVLNLLAVALLAGMRSLEAVAQFGRDHGTPLAAALGFRSRRTPCKATLSNLFRRLDPAAIESAVARWLAARSPARGGHLCLDGKAVRGSRDGALPAAHLLAAYAPRVAAVVGQIRVDGKTHEHKAALELLGVLPLAGQVVTGDAMVCHRDVCQKVRDGGGDYLFTVKDNQSTLHADIAGLFAGAAAFSPPPAAALASRAGQRHDGR